MKISLYLVGTPIGNMGDLSKRAAETLASVDFIAAEDTRVSGKLTSFLGIKKPFVSYYEHNKSFRGEEIVARLKGGETCALVTDAGMPAISDPGEDIVSLCIKEGLLVSVIPGPSAGISALAVSGLPTGRFCFEGFLPADKKERRARLEALLSEERTTILYEAPHRLKKTLAELEKALGGERRITLVRELTKLHEEIIPTDLSSALSLYEESEPRGEFVLVLEGVEKTAPKPEEGDIEKELSLLVSEGHSKSEAAKILSKKYSLPKQEIYSRFFKE